MAPSDGVILGAETRKNQTTYAIGPGTESITAMHAYAPHMGSFKHVRRGPVKR